MARRKRKLGLGKAHDDDEESDGHAEHDTGNADVLPDTNAAEDQEADADRKSQLDLKPEKNADQPENTAERLANQPQRRLSEKKDVQIDQQPVQARSPVEMEDEAVPIRDKTPPRSPTTLSRPASRPLSPAPTSVGPRPASVSVLEATHRGWGALCASNSRAILVTLAVLVMAVMAVAVLPDYDEEPSIPLPASHSLKVVNEFVPDYHYKRELVTIVQEALRRNVRPASAQPVKIAIVGTNPTMAGKLVALFQHVAAAEEQILDVTQLSRDQVTQGIVEGLRQDPSALIVLQHFSTLGDMSLLHHCWSEQATILSKQQDAVSCRNALFVAVETDLPGADAREFSRQQGKDRLRFINDQLLPKLFSKATDHDDPDVDLNAVMRRLPQFVLPTY